jgi:hypothetical protein
MNYRYVKSFTIAMGVLLLAGSPECRAWSTYSTGEDPATGNCADCHGEFRGGDYTSNFDGTAWNAHLMDGHESFIGDSGNAACDICHSGNNRSPTFIASSDSSTKPYGCLGCHGRLDDGPGQFGDGLRANHMNSATYLGLAGGLTCAVCHAGDTTPVGEDFLPFNYSLAGTIMDPCSSEAQFGPTGLDNDGDGVRDAADADCAAVVPTLGDFDLDGMADVLLRNSSTGQNWMYLMNGSTISSSVGINSIPAPWAVAGTGDYDGNGTADILWRNGTTGQNWMYLMNGAAITSSLSVNTVAGSDWQVAGNGDYDGDGNADILWRNSATGQNWMYLMNGATIASSVGVNTVPSPWVIAGTGDFDGNGTADILWRNSTTGQNWMYLMNGATITSSLSVNTVAGLDWQVAGNGDYDGDGMDDILWRNSTTGQNWMYLMNGATIAGSLGVNMVADLNWQIAGEGDYNGNGMADILWRNGATGQIWMYLMNGASINSSLGVNTVPTTWDIVNTR